MVFAMLVCTGLGGMKALVILQNWKEFRKKIDFTYKMGDEKTKRRGRVRERDEELVVIGEEMDILRSVNVFSSGEIDEKELKEMKELAKSSHLVRRWLVQYGVDMEEDDGKDGTGEDVLKESE